MSERLTPQQQREMRVRMGSEVQGLSESVSGSLPRDPDKVPLRQEINDFHQRICEQFFKLTGVSVEPTREDKLCAAITEACMWLQQGAPGCALQTLENALKL